MMSIMDFVYDVAAPVRHRLTWKIPSSGGPNVPVDNYKLKFNTQHLQISSSGILQNEEPYSTRSSAKLPAYQKSLHHPSA